MKFKVLREHYGDRDYKTGDTRNADPTDVAHLVSLGVLEEPKAKAAPSTSNKAEPPVRNKAQQTPANKSGV